METFVTPAKTGKRGQASFEQLIVISIGLVLITVMFYLAATYTSDSLKISQTEDAVSRIAATADYVHSMGPNSREYVQVLLPQDIEEITINGKRIVMRVRTSSGQSDIFANAHAELIGAMPSARGKQKLLVQYLESGKILIGEAGMTCSPSLITRALNASGTGSDNVTITNNADFNVTGITAVFSGVASNLASIGAAPGSLASGAQANISVNYHVPSLQQPGTYSGVLLVETGNDGACATDVNIYVNSNRTCGGLCVSQGYSDGACRAGPESCIASGEDYLSQYDEACGASYCCCGPSQDVVGPRVSWMNSTPFNASTADNVMIIALCNDTETGGSYIKSAELAIDNTENWTGMNSADGAFGSSVLELVNLSVGSLNVGQHFAVARCTDTANNTGNPKYYFFNITEADKIPPIIIQMTHTDYPTTLTNISVGGTATDEYTGKSNIQGCMVKVDYGNWVNAEAIDGFYNSTIEDYTYNVGPLAAGFHTIYHQCTDTAGYTGYNQESFGVVSVDMVLVLDKSGSMVWNATNITNNAAASTTNTGFTYMKNITVDVKNGNFANISVEMYSTASNCTAFFEVRIGANVIASGNRTSTSYGIVYVQNVSVSAYSAPFTATLYLKRSAGASCTAYARLFSFQQMPTKMDAAKNAAKTFVDVVGESTQVGLASYSTSSSLDYNIALMFPANKTALHESIDAITPTGSTCIQCGLETAANELVSSRGRDNATKVIVILTDGVGNVGNSVTGSVYCRDRNVTVYTIGFGNDVDDVELTNIALLTHGEYYFAPDARTLDEIFRNIGK